MSVPSGDAELLTRDELAARCGVHPRTVGHWLKAGLPRVAQKGEVLFPWSECRDWREKRLQEDKRATRHNVRDEELRYEIAKEKLAIAFAEREQVELDLAKRRGELIPLEFMVKEFSRIATAMRGVLLALPARCAKELAAVEPTLVDRRLALQRIMSEELFPVLRQLLLDESERDAEERQAKSTLSRIERRAKAAKRRRAKAAGGQKGA